MINNRTDASKTDVNSPTKRDRWFTASSRTTSATCSAAKLGCVEVGDQWSKICLDHGASKEPVNPFWSWIHRFLWCTMIQTDLGSPILIQITLKERTLIRLRVVPLFCLVRRAWRERNWPREILGVRRARGSRLQEIARPFFYFSFLSRHARRT